MDRHILFLKVIPTEDTGWLEDADNVQHFCLQASRVDTDTTLTGRGCGSVGRASDRHAAEAGSVPRCGKGFFFHSQLSVQTLLRCPYSLRVQSHAFTSVRTLNIPSTGSPTFVGTHEISPALLAMGSAALAAVFMPYPGKATRFSREGLMKSNNT